MNRLLAWTLQYITGQPIPSTEDILHHLDLDRGGDKSPETSHKKQYTGDILSLSPGTGGVKFAIHNKIWIPLVTKFRR